MAAEPSLPDGEDFFAPTGGQGDWDSFWETRTLAGGEPEVRNRSCLLGWPDLIQGSFFRECALTDRGHYLGSGPVDLSPEDARAERDAVEDWQLLFQLDTVQDGEFELMFGDCGRLFFYIRREDLAAGRFDCCQLVLQC